MSRKKQNTSRFHFFADLRPETVRRVTAVLLFVLALALILSATKNAGIAGDTLYHFLSFLLGVGYFLIPAVFLFVAFSLFRSEGEKTSLTKTIGALLFVISGLGLIDTVFDNKGGVVGNLIATPLVSFVDLYATLLFLAAGIVISILIIFNTKLRLYPQGLGSFWQRVTNHIGGNAGTQEATLHTYGDPDDKEEDEEEDEEDTEEEEEAPVRETVPMTGESARVQEGNEVFRIPTPSGNYTPPPLSLLQRDKGKPSVGDTKANANLIKRTLQNFGIEVEMDEISVGPTVTRYALKPAEGVRISKIVSLQNNLELALAAHPVRIEAPIPGKSLVGIEVPNIAKATIGLASLLAAEEYNKNGKPLFVPLGRDIAGSPHYVDIAKMPHMLIAGATGSGKSVTIHSLITSLFFRNGPATLRFIMIDPKRVELTLYNKIPHLLTPVITDAKKTILALKWAAKEMDRRYDILEAEQVRDVASYHQNIYEPALKNKQSGKELPEAMPYILVVIDELADIMQTYPRELEAAIVRLAQMSRAVGIHLLLSTQRPSVNVITGLIKANIPARLALQVASQIDSRTILDTGGAEKLLGAGDMLFLSGEMSKPKRIQAPFISEDEVKKVVSFLASHNEEAIGVRIEFGNGNTAGGGVGGVLFEEELAGDDDDLYDQAKEFVEHAGKASTSYLQRKLRIGYARAARLVDLLEERGVIGPADGARPREVIGGENKEETAKEESHV